MKIDRSTSIKMRTESLERRRNHPKWPSHKTTFEPPHGRTQVFEIMPIGKAKHRGYCKYCYATHSNWWAMDPREASIDGDPMLLCGRCEYTSLKSFT
jgi:hypothetical protein